MKLEFRTHVLLKPRFIIKIVEIVFLLIITSLWRAEFDVGNSTVDGLSFGGPKDPDRTYLGTGIIVGYWLITLGLIFGLLLGPGKLEETFVELFYACLGGLFFLVIGGLAIDVGEELGDNDALDEYRSREYALGSMCIIEALIYIADAVLSVLT